MRLCQVDGCDQPHKAQGWCNGHYRSALARCLVVTRDDAMAPEANVNRLPVLRHP